MKNNIKKNIIDSIGFSVIYVLVEILLNIVKLDIVSLLESFLLHAFCYFVAVSFLRWIFKNK